MPSEVKIGRKAIPILPYSVTNREQIAEMTALIDYGCDFKCGVCKTYSKKYPDPNNYSNPTLIKQIKEQACCSRCALDSGYLDQLPNRAVAREVKKLFDPKLGFWRSGIGCSLPRKWRSNTCLTYNCSTASGSMSHTIHQALNK
jgi:hypothetical protein